MCRDTWCHSKWNSAHDEATRWAHLRRATVFSICITSTLLSWHPVLCVRSYFEMFTFFGFHIEHCFLVTKQAESRVSKSLGNDLPPATDFSIPSSNITALWAPTNTHIVQASHWPQPHSPSLCCNPISSVVFQCYSLDNGKMLVEWNFSLSWDWLWLKMEVSYWEGNKTRFSNNIRALKQILQKHPHFLN